MKMKLSKFYHSIELNDNVYSLYNSLIMDVIFVDKDKYQQIINLELDNKLEINQLKKIGIYVDSEKQDEEAYAIVKKRYDEVTNKVQIMYLILTSACNLACKYCFIENCSFNNKIENLMTKETAENAIKKYSDYMVEKDIAEGSIILYGGEPLVNWKVVVDAIEYSKKMRTKIKISMVTNATLLDIEKIKYLAKNNVEIGISIDGPKELNDKNRIYRVSNKSVYDEIIEKFPQLNICKCKYGLSMTVSEDLLNNQDKVLEWLKQLNVSSIFYNLYHFTSYSDNWENYYKRASDFLLKSYDQLSQFNIFDGRLNRKLDSVIESEFKFADCGAIGGNQMTIKPNGEVCVCHGYFKTDKYVIGNINIDSIDTMTNTDEMLFWRNRCTLNNDECIKCNALFTCGGGCSIQAEALFGDRNEIDKPFCIHTKSALKWVLQKCHDSMIDIEKRR